MDLGIQNRVALIMASSKGLGKAVAIELAKEGARVIICGTDETALETTKKEIEAIAPGKVVSIVCDITDDKHGSVPCNLGDTTIENPIYGVDRNSFERTAPYLPNSIDVMAVGNLPNELPRDASRYFGEQLIKFVLDDVRMGGSETINKATIIKNGLVNEPFSYMKDYVEQS